MASYILQVRLLQILTTRYSSERVHWASASFESRFTVLPNDKKKALKRLIWPLNLLCTIRMISSIGNSRYIQSLWLVVGFRCVQSIHLDPKDEPAANRYILGLESLLKRLALVIQLQATRILMVSCTLSPSSISSIALQVCSSLTFSSLLHDQF
jgi:hypothetical protein